jgi:hypothetical protein
MKRIVAATLALAMLLGAHGIAYAQCTTQTYLIHGRLSVCTTCCYGVACHTTCH